MPHNDRDDVIVLGKALPEPQIDAIVLGPLADEVVAVRRRERQDPDQLGALASPSSTRLLFARKDI